MSHNSPDQEELIKTLPEISYGKPKFKHRLEYLPFIIFSTFLEVLPLSLSRFFVHRLADFARLFLKKRNELSIEMMGKTLKSSPKEASDTLKKSYYNFADNWLSLCKNRPNGAQEKNINFHGFDFLKKAHKEGRGVVISTAHLGHWEYVPRLLYQAKIPVAIMATVQHNPLCDKYFNERRSLGGYHRILHNRLGVRHSLSFLKKGGILLILADIDIGPKGLRIPFMGIPASTPKWPAELSLRTNSYLVVGHNHKADHSHEITLNEPIDPHLLEGNKDDKVHELSHQMNNQLSEIIFQHPEQWFWLQRRWKSKV
ncbi:MAG: lysophospholipid acyltransferase family protein [Planctomycetes bacterium]|nr:lysophospholipid acyltransferase family protein [Planctomycetota bacterium]